MDPTDPGSNSRLDTVVCNFLNFILGFNRRYFFSVVGNFIILEDLRTQSLRGAYRGRFLHVRIYMDECVHVCKRLHRKKKER